MENLINILAMLTAGVSLAAGLINLLTGLHKDGERTERIFGILSLCLFVFLMLPPMGFITLDKAPYPTSIIIKRFFIFSYYILLTGFVEQYSGFKNRFFRVSIFVLLVSSYVLMIQTRSDSMKPAWLLVALIPFTLILLYGLTAAIRQLKTSERKAGKWLLAAMIIYGMLLIPGLINNLGNNFFANWFGPKMYFPIHLHLLAFIVIMSIRLREKSFEKFRLERRMRWGDTRWNSLIRNMHLLLVELDSLGNIRRFNPYAVTSLAIEDESAFINKNWFDHFVPKNESVSRRSYYLEGLQTGKLLPNFNTCIVARDGRELFISWTNIIVTNEDNFVTGTLNIGIDITEQESALKEIQSLKKELEKENLLLRKDQITDVPDHNIIGESEAILYAIHKARQVAPTNAAVLLEGETGVGKEMFANLIHRYGYRAEKPFIKVNCAALPADLIESELFGHEKGSFTGAIQSRKGRFEMANGGTIFLDEIGELPLSLQPKLLRVLQSGEFERIGGQQTIKVDVRVISATNRDLSSEIRNHHFREDLYYRLDVFPITIPALRNRKEDIPLLVNYLTARISKEHHKVIDNISKADLERLVDYSWPGNVRELINVLERSIISSQTSTLKLDWINGINHLGANLSIEEIERAHFLRVLKNCGWRINGPDGAAEKLGLNPNTLRSRLKKLKIVRNQESVLPVAKGNMTDNPDQKMI